MISYELLYSDDGLDFIHNEFLTFLAAKDSNLYSLYQKSTHYEDKSILLKLSPYVEEYIAEIFSITKNNNQLIEIHNIFNIISNVKRNFIQKQVLRDYKNAEPLSIDADEILAALEIAIGEKFNEYSFANAILKWQEDDKIDLLDKAKKYSAYACLTKNGQYRHKNGTLFNFPKKINPDNLVDLSLEHNIENRDGFNLTDKGATLQYAIDQTNYCIKCHHQNRDSCSTGLKDKDGSFKVNAHQDTMIGCPIDVKISEMNEAKQSGFSIAALAIICIDNPLLPATGHRICNECMKSCIYQKQEPVNIPQIETRILRDVLKLPYGFEIYSLLTRWNPLNFNNQLPKKFSGYKILVAGMGPSGFTLSHYLLNQGHFVYGIDALKIEPLNIKEELIKDSSKLMQDLDNRVISGFGGVVEYGITVRWNKNYLNIIRLILERRTTFKLASSTRLGSNITPQQAFNLGFDHIALCLGAGKPNLLNIENAMARGVRTASDFLMNLQLSGAFKKDSIANLQIRLPIIVIGGGLTAIDAATESLTYYARMVEKFLTKIENNPKYLDNLNEEEMIIAQEFIEHGKILRAERIKKNPNITKKLCELGGVKILYRKSLQNAPCYRLNHQELQKALEEGVNFIPEVTPIRIDVDKFKHVEFIHVTNKDQQSIKLKARTILVAAGTSPNNIIAKEYADLFQLDGKYLQSYNLDGEKVTPALLPKDSDINIIAAKTEDDKYTSFLGDLHPTFSGNVVKAMASAKKSYPIINQLLLKRKAEWNDDFPNQLADYFKSTIYSINILSDNIVELIIKSKTAAQNFKPGQFFRLQNFITSKTPLLEPLALTGAWVDKEKSLISLIILEMPGSSKYCRNLSIGEEISLMGPTGEETEIKNNEKVLLIGGGLGNAVLFSIGQAFRNANSNVTYFAGYKKLQDIYKIEQIHAAADQVFWCCDEEKYEENLRAQDSSFHGNILNAIRYYHQHNQIKLADYDRVIIIGSDKMMAAVSHAMSNEFASYISENVKIIASINSPMQCMMKEICAQCIQKHVDENGKVSFVFSCNQQDQKAKYVDFDFLNQRLSQNSLLEKIS
jgi:NADPH-dependent glutamate synthase beta subunit-like oxidoreductase/NAD(P)H-flavin reductase